MKLFVFFVSVTFISVNTENFIINLDEEWQNFKVTHEKSYETEDVQLLRKAIFSENFLKVQKHNELYQKKLVGYNLKINQFSDMTDEEFNLNHKGYRKSTAQNWTIPVTIFVAPENAILPDAVDWREKGAVTRIKTQRSCGSCWAFSSTGSLEGQYFIKTGILAKISEQNLIDCSTEQGNLGCEGGDFYPAFEYVKSNDGIDSEAAYPYEARDAECRYLDDGKVTSVQSITTIERGNEEALKAFVATRGPVSVAMDSRDDFKQYGGFGVYYNENCVSGETDPWNELDHAVLVVGYGSENGTDYWLIKNSWGEIWGDKGYAKVARNRNNNCGLASEAVMPNL